MKEILEVMIKNLVEDKDSVSINEVAQDSEIKFEVRVNEKDMGRVIGKKGKIAQSIRTVMKRGSRSVPVSDLWILSMTKRWWMLCSKPFLTGQSRKEWKNSKVLWATPIWTTKECWWKDSTNLARWQLSITIRIIPNTWNAWDLSKTKTGVNSKCLFPAKAFLKSI